MTSKTDMTMAYWWNDADTGNLSTKKACPNKTLSNKNRT